MTLELRAAVVPQHAVQQLFVGLAHGHRRVDGGADVMVVQHEVLVEPLQSRYGEPAAGPGDGLVHVLNIGSVCQYRKMQKRFDFMLLTPSMFSRL